MGQRMPIFMGEAPEYQILGDHMHIVWRELEFVLPVSVMLVATASAQEEIAKWRLATVGSVVKLPRRR